MADIEIDEVIPWHKFLLFGDSITQLSSIPFGFNLASSLQHAYARKMDVVIRGFSGYTSREAKLLIKPIFHQADHENGRIKIAMIFFGSNDCAHNEQQHVPVDEYTANLKEVADFLISKGVKVLIVGPAIMDARASPDRSAAQALEYNLAAKKLAEELDVGFVDLYTAFLRAAGIDRGFESDIDLTTPNNNASYLLFDGLHYTPAGYRYMHLAILRVIAAKYPELAPDNLHLLFPSDFEIDKSNVYKSLFPAVQKSKASMGVGLGLV